MPQTDTPVVLEVGVGSEVLLNQLSKRLGECALQCVAVCCIVLYSYPRAMPQTDTPVLLEVDTGSGMLPAQRTKKNTET